MHIYYLFIISRIILIVLYNKVKIIFINWGLGIGDWGLGPIPNPQSPIPNPQSPRYLKINK